MIEDSGRIDLQEITLQLPKSVLDFIDRFYGDPKEHIEREILNWIRVDLEETNGHELAERFNLQLAFKRVLGEAL